MEQRKQTQDIQCQTYGNLLKSFGAAFGTAMSKRQGIVQPLNRNSALGYTSHIRRICTPLPNDSKSIGRVSQLSVGIYLSIGITRWRQCGYYQSSNCGSSVSFHVDDNHYIRVC